MNLLSTTEKDLDHQFLNLINDISLLRNHFIDSKRR